MSFNKTIKKFLRPIKNYFYDAMFFRNNNNKKLFIRKKNSAINVVFVLYDLSTWKTENLYLAMLNHDRFNPILAVTRNTNIQGNELVLIEYIKSKSYEFLRLDEGLTIADQISSDIIIYQRPYNEEPLKHRYLSNKNIPYININYGFHSIIEEWSINRDIELRAWQYYFENELCAKPFRQFSRLHGRNIVVTGTPIMDALTQSKENFLNPWKNKDLRKRIIWAPHHTVGEDHMKGIGYGTFLDYAEMMLSIAEEYKKNVCFAFKPHPLLYKNLLKLWSQERVDAYYEKWRTMENTQFENGEYMGLFKHSDAMIHDCATFTMEYLAIGNPVMYLVREDRSTENVDECAKNSFNLHYHGKCIDDIQNFIDNVIMEIDPRKEERMEFVNQYLRPPHGKSACENIMNAILGIEEYKNC